MRIFSRLKNNAKKFALSLATRLLRSYGRLRFPETTSKGEGQVRHLLIYCPNLGGHRPLYLVRLLEFYLPRVERITLAYSGLLVDSAKQKYDVNARVPFLEKFINHPKITWTQVFPGVNRRKHLHDIVSLQETLQPDVTLFADGDALIHEFLYQLLPGFPRLHRPTYAVFILSEFFHEPFPRYRKVGWKNYLAKLRTLFFHRVALPNVPLLDGALHSDDKYVQWANTPRVTLLPELGGYPSDERHIPSGDRSFYARVTEAYQAFLSRHEGKEVILAFGDLEPRKGFRFLVRYVIEHPETILVRIGRTKPNYTEDWTTCLNRERLYKEDRFFELNVYVDDPDFIDVIFNSIRFLPLPYIQYYRTSSVMIQAISYKKPVIVPDIGLMGYRVKRYGLGLTFTPENYKNFAETVQRMRDAYPSFTPNLEAYMERFFSKEALENALQHTLEISRET